MGVNRPAISFTAMLSQPSRRELLRHGGEGGDGMHRAGGVTDRALGMFAGGLHGGDGDLQIANVVQRIEHAEHIDAIAGGLGDEGSHHVIGIMPIAEQVLAA